MASRPSHCGIRHLALTTPNLDEMTRFYTRFLGFRVEWSPDPDNVYLTSGGDNLAFHRSVTEGTNTDQLRTRERLDHFGLLVRDADDVDAWAEYLRGNGVELDKPPKTHRDGARSCYFSDPDGNQIQIIHHPPIVESL